MKKLRTDEIQRLTVDGAKRSAKHPIAVVLEDIRSIHNVGSIFRTGEAAAIKHIYLTGISGTPDNRMIHKTALGAQDVVPWSYESQIDDVINHLKSIRYTIAALEITNSPLRISTLDLSRFPIALIVGNEVTGVSDRVLNQCDVAFEIGQYGSKHSLNVSVAFGIAAFRLVDRFNQLVAEDSETKTDRTLHE